MKRSELAPVALFIFNRPHLVNEVFERIRAARPSRLLVVADGPRPGRSEDRELCEAARAIVSCPDWPCDLQTNFAEENLGCKMRMSSGLDWVFQQCTEAMVLEDDCLPGSSFFTFCSDMLIRYRDDDRIMHIGGDNFQDGIRRGNGSYFYSSYLSTWGWASWSRAWRYYDCKISTWPLAYCEKWLESVFDSPREVHYWDTIFDRLYRGDIDTWDYQWLYACWRRGGLGIQPNENLVSNIGAGPDATHFKEAHSTIGIPIRELEEYAHPTAIVQDREADRYTFEHHILNEQQANTGWLMRMKRALVLRRRLGDLRPRSWRY